MNEVVISRYKMLPTPGKNYRFAWKWGYVVKIPGRIDSDRGAGLKSAENYAKFAAPGMPIRREWEA